MRGRARRLLLAEGREAELLPVLSDSPVVSAPRSVAPKRRKKARRK